MRILMWLTIGFGAACALCAYFFPVTWILLLAAVSMAAAIGAFCFRPLRRFATALLGCTLGFVWFFGFHQIHLQPAAAVHDKTVFLYASASDYSYETTYGTVVDCRIELNGKRYSIGLYLDETHEIAPGDQITGEFSLRYTDPDHGEFSRYHQGKGTFLMAYQSGEVIVSSGESIDLAQKASVLRRSIRDTLHRCFPEDVVPFVQALLLGDSSELDYETDTAFRISGIRHIIAVSGLHVSILFGLISMLTFRRKWLTACICLPILVIFAAVAGFTPSVTRACIMVGLMILAQAVQREYDSPTALSFACLVMLLVNPLVITSVSFQLSVGCVAGILMFREPIQEWLMKPFGKIKGKSWKAKLVRWFTGSVAVTLSAMSITTPLCAIYFGTVSLIGVVTNLMTLWVVSFIFNGIIVTCLISLISVNIAMILGKILTIPIRYVLITAELLSKVPLAAVYTRSIYIVFWLVFLYILLTILLIQRERQPGNMIAAAVFGLCVSLMISWAEPMLDACRVTVLDVGQGQSILLQSNGYTFLVDCGGDHDEDTADIVAETLMSQGVWHLDGVILTHMDADHAGGLPYLLTRIDTDIILLPGTDADSAEELRLQTRGHVVPISEDMEMGFDGGEITIFAPLFVEDSNENSLCILFTTGKCDILITGDRSDFGERMLMRRVQLPDVDLLIAGHHGSKYSTSEELLDTVRPETVIISAGKDNRYGHPAPELLERLRSYGCTVYRTDENGTICYRG